MARMSFTDRAVADVRAPPGGRTEFWDAELPGFGLRVSGKGRKTWQLMYRVGGRKRRMTLGGYPALSLELARDAAVEALREVAKGRDPAAERAAMTGGPLTFEAFARAYVERYAKRRKRSWQADAGMIERDLLPVWRRRPAESISRRDVIELLERVMARGHPQAANRCHALLRKMFAWGIEVDLVTATPVTAVRAPAPPAERNRVLDDREIVALWGAWEQMAWPFGPLFQLLLLTGQRRSDLASLRLADIALADQVWRPPAEEGARGPALELPLSGYVMEILTALPRSKSAYVFPARGRPGRPISGFSASVERARGLSGIADWRVQDLRRTAAVGMARLAVPPELLDQILNLRTVSAVGLRGVYRQAAEAEEKRRALEAWAERVRRLVESGGGGLFA